MRDVAGRLSMSTDHVLALIAAGSLPAVNVAVPGNKKARCRVYEPALTAFLAARPTKQPPKKAKARRTEARPGFIEYF